MRTSNARWILFAACLLLCPLAFSAGTPDGDRLWTTVGSAGTLDEKSEGKVFFERAIVQKGESVPLPTARLQPLAKGGVDLGDSAVIRYNITAVDGLFGQPDIGMKIRFRAELGARVAAHLIEVDLMTGAEVTRLIFDTGGNPVPSGYHMEEVFTCGGRGEPFDFVNKAYYIEATLTTDPAVVGSVAGIEMIQVRATTCLPG